MEPSNSSELKPSAPPQQAPLSDTPQEGAAVGPVVSTSYGAVRGLESQGCFTFKGVPYADVPERFRRPKPPRMWDGVRDCLRYGKQPAQPFVGIKSALDMGRMAMQFAGLKRGPPDPGPLPKHVSEDCLYLNIVSPSLSGRAPVFCWIHGGAFIFGSGADGLYRGSAITRREGLVVVSINYRLGCFGFLNLPGVDSNCGTWDQLEALRWIQSEINHFGGDPGNVTIAGESAGGMSCGVLLASPLAQPFFQRAILMSGALSNVLKREDAAAVACNFCKRAGVWGSADGGTGVVDMAALRQLSTEKLLSAQLAVRGQMPFQPCVDGELVPDLPLKALASGAVRLEGKQVMLGSNVEEFNLFRPFPSRQQTLDAASNRIVAILAPSRMGAVSGESQQLEVQREVRDHLKSLRVDNKLASWNDAAKRFLSSLIFHAPAHLAAEALGRANCGGLFVYSFAFDAGRLGAAHAAELPLLFGNQHRHWILRELSGARKAPDAADAVSRELMARFGAFARTGSPNRPEADSGDAACLPWPTYSPEEVAPATFVFDHPCRVDRQPCGAVLKGTAALVRRARRPLGLKIKVESTSPPLARL